MLIDPTHRRWFLVCGLLAVAAVTLHGWLGRDVPGGLSGGTAVGLWYGVVGAGLMVAAGALASHRHLMALRPRWVRRWVGQRQTWLRAHIWLGLLSVFVIACHANWSFGGPLEIALWLLFAATIASGVFGLGLQIVLPRLITNRVSAEAPYEQVPNLCDEMRREADEALAAAEGKLKAFPTALSELRVMHGRARRFLARDYDRRSPLANPLRAELLFSNLRGVAGIDQAAEELARLEVLCDERRQLGEQEWMHRWLHAWLLVHVPLSLGLFVLGAAHAVMSVYW